MPNLTISKTTPQGYIVTASSPLRIGQLLEFHPSAIIRTVLTALDDRQYLVTTASSSPQDTQVNFKQWWSYKQPPSSARTVGSQFFEYSSSNATFKAKTVRLPKGHVAGSLGWDLWYRPDAEHPWLHVLKGNDADKSGEVAHTELNALWPAGVWLFKATCFYKTNLVPISSVEVPFELSSSNSDISFTYQLNHAVL